MTRAFQNIILLALALHISVLNMFSDQASRQMKEGLYWRSAYCAQYKLETCLASSEETRVVGLHLQLICAKYGRQTWLAQTKEICLLLLNPQPISDEWVHETLLTPTEEIRINTLRYI